MLTIEEIASQSKSALATGPFGSSIGSDTFRDKGVPVIRGSNLSEDVGVRLREQDLVFIDEELARKFQRSVARLGDLVFTCWGTINQVGIVDERCRFQEFVVSNKQMKLTPDPNKAIPLYLYYCFSGPEGQHQIAINAIGSSVPGFNLTKLRSIKIPVPPLAEQRRIVECLAALDDKIELNRRMNETLEAMAQTIFRDWFVDFGPTRRKIEGSTDPVEIMGGLVADGNRAQQLADLFPASFGDNGLPTPWVKRPLKETLVLQRGFDLPKTERTSGEFPVIAASGLNGTHSEFKVAAPGVCTGRSGVLGNVFYVQTDFWPLNTSLWVKEYPNSTPIYAYFILRDLDLNVLNAGSAVPTLNRNHVHERDVVTPPMSVISEFDKIASLMMQTAYKSQGESRTLAAIRDLLLPKLMSGEIRLGKAEAIAEAAE